MTGARPNIVDCNHRIVHIQGAAELELLAIRERAQLLGENVASAPGWTILLHLVAARDGSQIRSAEDLANYCDMSLATALRWLAILSAENLIIRVPTLGGEWALLTELGVRHMARLLGVDRAEWSCQSKVDASDRAG